MVEALLEFFQMADKEQRPKANSPHSVHVLTEEYRKTYIMEVVDKFLDEFVFHGGDKASDRDNTRGGWKPIPACIATH